MPTVLMYISTISLIFHAKEQQPRCTIIFVIDQFAPQSLSMIAPYVTDGLKTLLTKGFVFTNAHHPHGMPATCTGHTALSTGAYGSEHGIVGNSWYDATGTNIACDTASTTDAAVLAPNGVYDYGKSPQHIMVDGVSDQFVLSGRPEIPRHAYAISLKSRAAIATANRAGIAIWFDTQSGMFTSSKAYLNELPEWLTSFNEANKVASPGSVYWKQKYSHNAAAYAFFDVDNYRYVRLKKALVNTTIPIGPEVNSKNPYALFVLTPQANQLVCDCAKDCLKSYISEPTSDELLLWICISSLDKVGHQFGPWSRETLDMLYHLDTQIGDVMRTAEALISPEKILYILTSDHGISPIVEQLHDRGVKLGRRIESKKLIKHLNKSIENEYGYRNLVYGTKGHQLYLNTTLLRTIPHTKRDAIIRDLQHTIETYEGIKKVWTHKELSSQCFSPYSAEEYFKQQLFRNRSGTLIMQVYPYTIISAHKYGTSHKTPYTHNTNVPLILYQKNSIQKMKTATKVTTLQLAPTLAQILHTSQPSAAMSDVLPGIITE
jgi:predicted AlkP superfamily pyrophosphatase or phosphodiesterase